MCYVLLSVGLMPLAQPYLWIHTSWTLPVETWSIWKAEKSMDFVFRLPVFLAGPSLLHLHLFLGHYPLYVHFSIRFNYFYHFGPSFYVLENWNTELFPYLSHLRYKPGNLFPALLNHILTRDHIIWKWASTALSLFSSERAQAGESSSRHGIWWYAWSILIQLNY